MTGTPPSAPNQPYGDNPAQQGRGQYAADPGRHQNPQPAPYSAPQEPPGGHGRHELPGAAGYPQFGGPGAAQYGSEPVEPPPNLHPQSGAPQGYGPGAPQGYGPGAPQQYQPGAMPAGGPPQGNPPPPGGFAPQGGFAPPPAGAPRTDTAQFPPAGAAPVYDRERLNVGHAIAYGWDRFRLNPVPWAGMVLIGLIAWLVVILMVNILDVQSLSGVLLLCAVAALVVWLLQAAMVRGGLYETDGTPPDFPAFFGFVNAGNVLITALIVFVACLIASMAWVFPAIIIGVLCMFALHFVIDQDQDPLTAIKSSAQLVVANALQVILLALAVMIITFIGAMLCGLGLMVAGPVCAIAITYAYRDLTGGFIAPL
ncbi:hypothetical protein ABZ319_14560 [Nocardia sp. NPDC005978]|uniref:hypothetical protein n=1 Tax=Nocardia sp. NPDC005978 TaxID=3156725 RepID=UPI0033BEA4EB